MRNVRTVSVSLEPSYADALKRLAARTGSQSNAIRYLLDAYRQSEAARNLEDAYRAYFAEPGAAKKERALTESLLAIAHWPPMTAGGSHDRRRRASR